MPDIELNRVQNFALVSSDDTTDIHAIVGTLETVSSTLCLVSLALAEAHDNPEEDGSGQHSALVGAATPRS
jgi:hypothetical protein